VVGALLRLGGVRYGTPYIFHPDEARIILDSLSMGQRLSLLSIDVNYPLLYKYLLLVGYGIYFVTGKAYGVFLDRLDFATNFMLHPNIILILSRIITSIIGVSTIVVGFIWGKKIEKSITTGLLAALFISLEWQLVLESQFTLHQSLAALSALLAFYGISLIITNGNLKSYIWAGVFFGIAISSHHTSVLLIPSIIYCIYHTYKARKTSKNFIRNWGYFSATSIILGIFGNLNWILQFQKSLNFLTQGSGAGKVAFSSTPFYIYNIPSIIFWFFKELIIWDSFIGVILLFGIFHSIKKHSKTDVLYIILLATYFIFFHNWAFRWMHLFVAILPISCIYGAKALNTYLSSIHLVEKKKFISALIILSIIPNIIQLVKVDIMKNKVETRQLAKEWVEKNIAPKTKIAVDWSAYAVPLESDIPTIMRNNVAKNYYDTYIPQKVKNDYVKGLDEDKKYILYQIINPHKSPTWPTNMPKSAIKSANTLAVFRDLYSYFTFEPLEKLKKEGVEYIIIESYTYGMFLEQNDPSKIFLHNIYFKDNINSFNNHDGYLATGSQNELLYYLAKEGRDYFKVLLKEEGARLIKEFFPSNRTLGPVVKIYQLL